MRAMLDLETARWRLATVWFIGSGLVFLFLVAQSLGGLFGSEVDKAWAWALPNIVPTLSLMISVFATYALVTDAEEDRFVVRRPFFQLSFWLSIFYLLNLFIVIGAAPFAAAGTRGPLDILHVANFWLGALQGFTAASLAALFFTKTGKESGTAPGKSGNPDR